jgi:hypothetical protein
MSTHSLRPGANQGIIPKNSALQSFFERKARPGLRRDHNATGVLRHAGASKL